MYNTLTLQSMIRGMALYDAISRHFSRYIILYLWLLAGLSIFCRYYTIAINVDYSLPGSLYLISKYEMPHKGDYVAFAVPKSLELYRVMGEKVRTSKVNGVEEGRFTDSMYFLKIVGGVEGDTIQKRKAEDGGYDVFVNGSFMGHAKPVSKTGVTLYPIDQDIIPKNKFFVYGTHHDSFDSRYKTIGLIDQSMITGKAYKIF